MELDLSIFKTTTEKPVKTRGRCESGYFSYEGIELTPGSYPYFVNRSEGKWVLVRPQRPDSLQKYLSFSEVFYFDRKNAEAKVESLNKRDSRERKINELLD